ncbi:hypothetical protein lacNasYZ03_11050 [Lactobacillus nasalidis]|uniref:GyrI-like small molecule binding domain-containing protein n=1 Tax=Lactobacillus nasalidis TaxID=2797258 RepID=A0ABQ3W4H2_9LACO|nr:hypothetical protein [Lactobacillus nasalidis]GHV98493.1 hypothetical protein lacNasYZ01_16750 [Lactobacillus nasalidis]GHV99586.1 hypothetical protein lacNasYZ02_10160 [Lactobacillus nasalidis]GHW01418.1 hypothetical protein lacNasYZ03_11050 [Lactobacillus nasalidis]
MQTEINELTFIGKAFPDRMMDANGTFAASNQELEEDPAFQKFVQEAGVGNQRASLIVFGPENFMYWYGVLAPQASAPAGLLKFALPQARVFQKEETANAAYFDLPLNFELPRFLDEAGDLGSDFQLRLEENSNPYILRQLDLDSKKLTKSLYLPVSQN